MLPIDIFLENVNFQELLIPFGDAVPDEQGKVVKEGVGIFYSRFIQTEIF